MIGYLFFATIIYCIVAFFAAQEFGARGVAVVGLVCSALSFPIRNPLFLLVFFGTAFLAGVISLMTTRPAAAKFCALLPLVVIISIGVYSSTQQMHRVDEIRQEYPIVSLADRLAYEDAHLEAAEQTIPTLSSEAEERLSTRETRSERYCHRTRMLNRLHSKYEQDSVLAEGFGFDRVIRMRRDRIAFPETEPIPLPAAPERYADSGIDPDDASIDSSISEERLRVTHDYGFLDFVNPESFGYVRSRDFVVGFRPHGFARMPYSAPTTLWQITRLELISLLRHETPVAYVSQNLPRMEELVEAATRPLNPFEVAALERLRTEEDLVIEEGTNLIRMVGSLRAGSDCLACHGVERGELLGAFSYDISRMDPIPQPEEATPHAMLQSAAPGPF